MSILIKEMEMPKSCPCELVGIGYDMYCSFVHGIPAMVKEYDECCEKETRPDWCPLVEVPKPHGRLIDASEAYDRIAEQEGGNYVDMDAVGMGLDETPTVIPASEEE